MSELHLELCRQSTKHLKDTIASIKENLRILEVFIDSGLTDDSRIGNAVSALDSTLEPLDGEILKDSDKLKKGISKTELHPQCCCMCPSRLRRNSCSMYHGSRVASSSANHRSKRPVSMPRLNRTASLRRDTAAERVHMSALSNSR